jgi:aspartate ammonia-lyase
LTVLVLHICYENASRIAGHASLSGSGVAELVKQEKLLSDEELAAILSPNRMVSSI